MSRYSGPQRPGIHIETREQKRAEAESRNARTPSHLRKAYRRDFGIRLLVEVFEGHKS